jgi:hypothetical protein
MRAAGEPEAQILSDAKRVPRKAGRLVAGDAATAQAQSKTAGVRSFGRRLQGKAEAFAAAGGDG